ncbi:LPS export ABC transporter permease LptG [Novosphingobium sp. Gsoil 351]|uniref:LPS export ABC transporter permease LptG n=1 Tax=Novosphingobium sp. Gsoil 351 TaxID=2675225 RepID=UPI0012B4E4CB|nr:LPS export ABC transporter permease LptG [Novosphingobium sp. Gsoil 351]QGN55218.1 LPS export ABC transporter permease LptG [Novosphingobium sp. Gsoil 351]
MQFEFFPSRTVTLYIAKMFAVRIVAVLGMLVLVLQMLDLLGESGKILEAAGNGQAQVWHYVTLRVPSLVQTFLPYSVLLATILTLVQLNQNSEVISMKAAGLSAHQILAPLVLTAMLVAGISFGFNERLATRAASTLKAWQAVQYGKVPLAAAAKTNVWLADGANVLYAQAIGGTGADTTMTGVSWYRRDEAGRVIDIVTAPKATYAAPGWRLETPRSFAVQSVKLEKMPAATIVAERITPEQIAISKVDADAEDLFTLRSSIDAMQAAGRRTGELESAWWHKISGPLSAVLMPLLGAVAAFGLARSGHVLVRAAIGMALGFAFFVVDNAALAMGSLGGYPPLLAAWAPFVLFALIGETVLIRTEE